MPRQVIQKGNNFQNFIKLTAHKNCEIRLTDKSKPLRRNYDRCQVAAAREDTGRYLGQRRRKIHALQSSGIRERRLRKHVSVMREDTNMMSD